MSLTFEEAYALAVAHNHSNIPASNLMHRYISKYIGMTPSASRAVHNVTRQAFLTRVAKVLMSDYPIESIRFETAEEEKLAFHRLFKQAIHLYAYELGKRNLNPRGFDFVFRTTATTFALVATIGMSCKSDPKQDRVCKFGDVWQYWSNPHALGDQPVGIWINRSHPAVLELETVRNEVDLYNEILRVTADGPPE